MNIIGFRMNAMTVTNRRIVVFVIHSAFVLPVSSFACGAGHRSGGYASGSYSDVETWDSLSLVNLIITIEAKCISFLSRKNCSSNAMWII
jgi:hypothetical protein